MVRQGKSPLCVGLSEVQAYVRAETGEEEALLASLLRVASESCEAFIGQVLLDRTFEQDLTGRAGWTMLGVQPVRSITSVTLEDGEPFPGSAYEVDIDHDGRAFVRGLGEAVRATVSGVAGLGTDANVVPEPLRQGIVRLAAHLFANRDSAVGELPAAVTALWRPYRRAGLCL